MRSRLTTLLAITATAHANSASQLQSTLQRLIDAAAAHDNISYSFAVALGDGTTVAAAAGWDDRANGTRVTNDSLFPVGSVTKPYTTVAALRLSEQGRLDLDAPVHTLVDPWLSKRSQPTIMEMWKGHEAEIGVVTSRMLLSMQSGMPDYDSHQLQLWTLEHPAADFLPIQFLQNVSKAFLFQPGEGGAYSGDGYVLMGLVLAAVLDADDWSDLDQLKLTFGEHAADFGLTRFMPTGPCSQDARVVHQYGLDPRKHGGPGRARDAPGALGAALGAAAGSLGAGFGTAAGDDTCDGLPEQQGVRPVGRVAHEAGGVSDRGACCAAAQAFAGRTPMMWAFNASDGSCTIYDQVWGHVAAPAGVIGRAGPKAPTPTCDATPDHGNVALDGHAVGWMPEANLSACCALAESVSQGQRTVMWTFAQGNCTIFDRVDKMRPQPGTAVGRAGPQPKPLTADDFYDLYGESCLNGWTMGNIAVAPGDVARFYRLLASGGLVSAASLAQMQHYRNFSNGWNKGTGMRYGMGLLTVPSNFVDASGRTPNYTEWWGHFGADWGSAMVQLAGHYPLLNASLALAQNAIHPMNFSRAYQPEPNPGRDPAGHGGVGSKLSCQLLDAVAAHVLPLSPRLQCDDGGAAIVEAAAA